MVDVDERSLGEPLDVEVLLEISEEESDDSSEDVEFMMQLTTMKESVARDVNVEIVEVAIVGSEQSFDSSEYLEFVMQFEVLEESAASVIYVEFVNGEAIVEEDSIASSDDVKVVMQLTSVSESVASSDDIIMAEEVDSAYWIEEDANEIDYLHSDLLNGSTRSSLANYHHDQVHYEFNSEFFSNPFDSSSSSLFNFSDSSIVSSMTSSRIGSLNDINEVQIDSAAIESSFNLEGLSSSSSSTSYLGFLHEDASENLSFATGEIEEVVYDKEGDIPQYDGEHSIEKGSFEAAVHSDDGNAAEGSLSVGNGGRYAEGEQHQLEKATSELVQDILRREMMPTISLSSLSSSNGSFTSVRSSDPYRANIVVHMRNNPSRI